MLPTTVFNVGHSSNDFRLYPNPATKQLTIESRQTTTGKIELVEIYDVLGVRCLTPTLSPDKNRDRHGEGVSVDVSSLASGIYFVKVKTKEGESVAKFVKE